MTVRATRDCVALEGNCPAEDAETLIGLLIENPGTMVDLAECGSVHTAVAQVLIAARPAMRGVPADPLLAEWILPQVLDAATETNSRQGSGRLP